MLAGSDFLLIKLGFGIDMIGYEVLRKSNNAKSEKRCRGKTKSWSRADATQIQHRTDVAPDALHLYQRLPDGKSACKRIT